MHQVAISLKMLSLLVISEAKESSMCTGGYNNNWHYLNVLTHLDLRHCAL